MAGTQAGGRKAAATNKMRYGLTFYTQIGRKGGKISRGGGFAVNRELASEAGRKGGMASRRGVNKPKYSAGPTEQDYRETIDPKHETLMGKIRKRLATRV